MISFSNSSMRFDVGLHMESSKCFKLPHVEILSLIPTGQRNARHVNEIAALLGFRNRELRKHIEHLRREGHVIIGCDKGYYLPETLEELEAYLHQETARAKSILYTLKAAQNLRSLWLREAAAESLHLLDVNSEG